jgi:hypothetical protein
LLINFSQVELFFKKKGDATKSVLLQNEKKTVRVVTEAATGENHHNKS